MKDGKTNLFDYLHKYSGKESSSQKYNGGMTMGNNMTHFKPRARLMLELGEQLIKNESVAILELIKNCYDAFASQVKVELTKLDDIDNGRIIIQDNGVGMTRYIVENYWMEPATLHKKK